MAPPETVSGPGAAGLLLTGGASSRMGADKSGLVLEGFDETLAERSGRLLAAAVAPGPALEVGPGVSGLRRAAGYGVDDPGEGPLTAVVAGRRALEKAGWAGAVLVLATDLPAVTLEALRWLVGFPATGSVVPVVGGRRQPLVARWCPADLDRAAELAGRGERSLRQVFGPGTCFVDEAAFGEVATAAAFSDVDTPAELEALRRRGRRFPPAPPRGGR